ncbi:hypothetical protein FB567DRAFT_627927 [Paraphoma chrysanthemicola]|uniref:Uncharacterized protein n=1 Tax=Paraphoma chrysanthemicola TaxID=798071 RepID=A0A8K0R9G2_9PLEO|nr:hypothetical protein FB567DRAFT_627927 [Paraphoma chrysanthemicola]
MAHHQPFPFMALPKELRLMVYERLPRTVRHTRITDPGNLQGNAPKSILITRHIPVSILSASRELHAEAKPIVQQLINEFILGHPPRLMGDFASTITLMLLIDMVELLMCVMKDLHRRSIPTNSKTFESSQARIFEAFKVDEGVHKFVRQAARQIAAHGGSLPIETAIEFLSLRRSSQQKSISDVVSIPDLICNERLDHSHSSRDKDQRTSIRAVDIGIVIIEEGQDDVENIDSCIPKIWNEQMRELSERSILEYLSSPDDTMYAGLFTTMDEAIWIEDWLPS